MPDDLWSHLVVPVIQALDPPRATGRKRGDLRRALDGIIYVDGLNRLQYVRSNAIRFRDAFGLQAGGGATPPTIPVAQDAGDPAAQALVLWGGSVGPITMAETAATFPPGTTAGEAGIVFGYKSMGDYWLCVEDLAAQQNKIYHVVGGVRTLITASAQSATAGSAFGVGLIGQARWLSSTPLADGFPSGRVGLYATVAGVTFDYLTLKHPARANDGARWVSLNNPYISEDGLTTWADWTNALTPTYLKNLTLQKFEAATRRQCGRGPVSFLRSGSRRSFPCGRVSLSNLLNLTCRKLGTARPLASRIVSKISYSQSSNLVLTRV
jgi:hypothetical protein